MKNGQLFRTACLAALVGLSSAPAWAAGNDWQQLIAEGLGKPGTAMPGDVYRVGLPRADLKVTLDGVELKPGFALGSWLAFKKTDNDVMAMGDLVLTEKEINPVMQRLEESGIEITAVHNHLLRAAPATFYMHVLGHGDPGKLAATFREALAASKTPIQSAAPGSPQPAASEQRTDFDTAALDQALGRKGKVNGGIYQVSVPRAEAVKDHGMEVPEPMGSAIAINFQPTGGGKAAITGDFV